MDFEDRFPGFESWFCPLMAGKLWTGYLTSLGLSFFMYKMWVKIIIPTLEGCEDFMN